MSRTKRVYNDPSYFDQRRYHPYKQWKGYICDCKYCRLRRFGKWIYLSHAKSNLKAQAVRDELSITIK